MELKRVRRLGFWRFRARDCPTLARLCGPAPAGHPAEAPIRERLLDLLDPTVLDEHGRPRQRMPLEQRDRMDDGLFGRILFGEPGPMSLAGIGPRGQARDVCPRDLLLTGRYDLLASLRGVHISTVNKVPKEREPRGGQAHQVLLDLVAALKVRSDVSMPKRSDQEGRRASRARLRPSAEWAAALVVCGLGVAGVALALTGTLGAARRHSGCVFVLRPPPGFLNAYLQTFTNFAEQIGSLGDGRLCLIVAGAPMTIIAVGPAHRYATTLSAAEIARRVADATARLRHMLTGYRRGHSISTADAAFEVAKFLRPGDRFLVLSTGFEEVPGAGDLATGMHSATDVESAMLGMISRGYIASLSGVQISMPFLGETGNGIDEAALGVSAFWQMWARRAGASLSTRRF